MTPPDLSLQRQLAIALPSPEVPVDWLEANQAKVALWVKRDDRLHPIISGNKWRKLKYALLQAQQQNIQHIISFGGGYSNHLHALSYCCQQLGVRLTALVRGNYTHHLTPMLRDLTDWQTEIHYLTKIEYQHRTDPDFLHRLQQRHPKALIIPEGGSQQLALAGVAEIISELQQHYDYIIAPVASGGTLAGLINAAPNDCTTLGVAVLKGEDYLQKLVGDLLPNTQANWQLEHRYHWGGYAKAPEELMAFCQQFSQHTAIPTEPVYSGKLFYALQQLLQQGFFKPGSRLLALHTGGLQGARTH